MNFKIRSCCTKGVEIAEKLVMFMLLILMSYMQSISAFVAQNVGAGQVARTKKTLWTEMFITVILGGIMSYLSFFYSDLLSCIFIKEQPVINVSAEFLKATSIACFFLSIACCLTGYYNVLRKTTFVMTQGLYAIFLVKHSYA